MIEVFAFCPRCGLVGNYIFERKNEVMLCYHAVATGLAVADWMRSRGLAFEWDERAPLKAEVDRT